MFMLPAITQARQEYDISRFGAVADSVTLNTKSIQKAIDQAAKKGGRVLVPSGSYLTGTLVLKSGVELHLAEGAVLLGSSRLDDYPVQEIKREFYGKVWKNKALIFAHRQRNISITGKGMIDGRGHFFWPKTDQKPDRYFNRPYGLLIVECTNVKVKGVQLRNSAYWMQHYMACDQLRIEDIYVYNHANQNNDGLDIDGCSRVRIARVTIDSDDDALCFKSLSLTPCSKVRVKNVTLSSHCNAFKLGTESVGGFIDFKVKNVRITPSADTVPHFGNRYGDGGIALQIVDGGSMRNICLRNFEINGPRSPLSIRLGNRARPYSPEKPGAPQGSISKIRIDRVKALSYDSIGSYIMATEQGRIQDVKISRLEQRIQTGSTESVCLEDEKSTAYPEGKMHGVLPVYGLYLHKTERVTLRDCRFTSSGAGIELRKPVVFVQSSFRSIKALRAQGQRIDPKLLLPCRGQ